MAPRTDSFLKFLPRSQNFADATFVVGGELSMRITIRTKKGTLVNRVTCEADEFLIGATPDALVSLSGWKVSKRHALVKKNKNEVFIKDLDSRTGTYLDDEQIGDVFMPIAHGESIRVGDYVIEILDAPTATTPVFEEVEEPPEEKNPTDQPPIMEADLVALGKVSLEREWRTRIHKQLIDVIDLRRINLSELSDAALREMTGGLIKDALEKAGDFPVAIIDKKIIAKQVLEEAVGLGPLEDLIARDDISEIMVNAHDEIYFEKQGKIEKSLITFSDNKAVLSAIERIVAPLGRRIDESSPMVDARLKDGSRVNAIIPPLALKGPCITIRKFMQEKLTAEKLAGFNSISTPMIKFINLA